MQARRHFVALRFQLDNRAGLNFVMTAIDQLRQKLRGRYPAMPRVDRTESRLRRAYSEGPKMYLMELF